MNIRKHWKKILLSSTALFWASCGGDSESSVSPLPDIPESSEATTSSDTGSEALSSSCAVTESSSSTVAPESSSEVAQSSSSVAEQSSSSKKTYPQWDPFILASDTSTTCEVTDVFINYHEDTRIKSPSELMELLESNTTRSVESLELLEDELEESLNYGVLYGSPSTTYGFDVIPSKFECTNDSVYTTETHVGVGHYLYTKEEYKKKFPNQDPDKPSPLCQKTDFILCGGTPYMESGKERTFVGSIFTNYDSDKDALIDSVKAANGDNLSDAQKNCLDSNVTSKDVYKNLDGKTFHNATGPIATKQICDGDTTVNPRYQAKLDSNKAFIKKQIDECLGKSE